MNEFQMDTILTMLADSHNAVKSTSESRLVEIERLQDKLYEREEKVRAYDRVVEDREYYMNALSKANEDLQTALAELRQYKLGDPSIKGKADAFMASHPELHDMTHRIACIKEVRSLTGWGLKEAKDYVEAYVKDHPYTGKGDYSKQA